MPRPASWLPPWERAIEWCRAAGYAWNYDRTVSEEFVNDIAEEAYRRGVEHGREDHDTPINLIEVRVPCPVYYDGPQPKERSCSESEKPKTGSETGL
jgi:hypothetical protein